MKQKKAKTEQDLNEFLSSIDEKFIKSFAAVHCLSIIAKGHKHGYDIMKYIQREYNIKVSAGSLYPLLQYLEDHKFIKGIWEHSQGKPGKKMYEVTPEGRKYLSAVKTRLISLVKNLPTTENP